MAELAGQDLALIRGDRCLFQALNFTVGSGELLVVEGRNGSGKTSLLRAIAGLNDPDEGAIRWNNTNVKQNRQYFHALLVWMGHRPGFKGDLTLIENLRFEAGLRSMTTSRAEHHLLRLGIASLTNIPFRALSAGQQRRVALARMCLADAPLWLMDEPFTNMDTEGQALVVDVLREHLQNGGMCVMATHQRFEIDVKIRRIRLQ